MYPPLPAGSPSVLITMDRRHEAFFKLAFGQVSGYVCIAHKAEKMHESFFYYPDELVKMLEHIERVSLEYDTYYCSQVFASRKRNKDNVQQAPNAWADLDTCHPDILLVKPTISLETSPERYQALWVFDKPIQAESAEEVSRRIAYYHADDGADRSGWDLTQLLRVPFTTNLKYDEPWEVKILEANQKRYRVSDFNEYPQAEGFEYLDEPFPDDFPEEEATSILDRVKREANPRIWSLFYETPAEHAWSEKLWELELLLFETGLDREHVFLVAEAAACNKYKREGRPRHYLWQEVCRAYAKFKEQEKKSLLWVPDELDRVELLSDDERTQVESKDTFITKYVNWAKTLGDAAWQYHEVAAFIVLSTVISNFVKLPTSYGLVLPNLWVMILADTTLTRKTTAMDLAVEMVLEVEQSAVLATDGSIEGLLTSLSTRPGKSSIFLRDEFSGLLELMTKRDYYAGMGETLTKLYDGKFQKRVLRKETIEIRDPVLVLFAGGIKSRVTELLDYQHVASGFLPRFIFVMAESDVTKLKPLGPPTDQTLEGRNKLVEYLQSLYNHYNTTQTLRIKLGDSEKEVTQQKQWKASLTPEAWARYNKYEADLVAKGLDSDRADLMTPTMDRLAKSGLKMSVLIAGAKAESEVVVTEEDIITAFYYIEKWSAFTLDLLRNIGKGTSERLMERIYRSIKKSPGVTRSQLMQSYHLTARDADFIFETLEQRGMIIKEKAGRGYKYEPAV